MDQDTPSPERPSPKGIPVISLVGMVVFLTGVSLVGFFWLFYSTAVDGVHNVGLMQNRQLGVIVGLVLALTGLAGAVLSHFLNRGRQISAGTASAASLSIQTKTIGRSLMAVGGVFLLVLVGLGFRSKVAPFGVVAGVYTSVENSDAGPRLYDWELDGSGEVHLVETGSPSSRLPFGQFEVRSSLFGGTTVIIFKIESSKPLFTLSAVKSGLLGDPKELWDGKPLYLQRDPVNYEDDAKDFVYKDLRRKDLKSARDSFEMHVLFDIESRVKEGSLTPAQGAVATAKRWMQFVHLLKHATYTGSMFSDPKPPTANDPYEAEVAKMEEELLLKAAPALKQAIEAISAEEKRLR